MAQLDKIHDAVKNALIKDGWTITADPFRIEFEEYRLYADLAAERPIAAVRENEKIVVEIKSFLNRSSVSDFENALGQYLIYRRLISQIEPETKIYLAISEATYTDFFTLKATQFIIETEQVSLSYGKFGKRGNRAMDKTLKYKKLVKEILNRYVEIDRQQPQEGIDYFLVADDAQGHYLWTSLGWSKGKRTRYVHAHLRIKDEKIWIETDLTEQGIATDLLSENVPKADIVLAFQEPSMRKYNEFATA